MGPFNAPFSWDSLQSALSPVYELSGPSAMFGLGIIAFLVCTAVWIWMKTFNRGLDLRIPVFKFPTFSLIGSLYAMPSTKFSQALGQNVYFLQIVQALSVLYKTKDIFCIWMAFSPFIILRKAEVVEELLKSNTLLQKAWTYNLIHPWLGQGLLTSYGSRWRTRRKLLTPSFHFDILKDFQLVFDDKSKVLVNSLKKHCKEDWVDIVPHITLCSLDIICESTLGVKMDAQMNADSEYVRAVIRTTDAVMDRLQTPLYWIDFVYNISPAGRQFYKDVAFLHKFARDVIRERKSAILHQIGNSEKSSTEFRPRKRQALMDLLLDLHLSNQGLTEEDIREEIDTFAFEGHDTTSMGMSWALYLIGLYPEVQAKVHEELDRIFGDDTDRDVTVEDLKEMHYLECVLKESQRLYPSVPSFERQVEEDIVFHGYNLKKGTTLNVFSYLLHRDKDVFPDPEKFDPERFSPENSQGRHAYAYIPFSAGPRNCIGQRFAMMEEKTVVAHILRNFLLRSMEPRDRICPAFELVLRPAQPLKIKITKRINK